MRRGWSTAGAGGPLPASRRVAACAAACLRRRAATLRACAVPPPPQGAVALATARRAPRARA
eukprot:10693412-Lingulodinium_polyedra.AAC.1